MDLGKVLQEKYRKISYLILIVGILFGMLLQLPQIQSLILFLLEKLKGGVIRQPDLWRGRIRSVSCTCLITCAIAIAMLSTPSKMRKKALYIILLVCAFALWILFPLNSRIFFLRFFKGLTPEVASDFKRLDFLLYKVLFLSAGFFLLAFLVKNFTFSPKLLKDRQSHTIIFSIVLIISFVTFYVGMPEWIEKTKSFWFYTDFDYSDYLQYILKRGCDDTYPPLANLITGVFKVFSYSPSYEQQWVTEYGMAGFNIVSSAGSFLILLFL